MNDFPSFRSSAIRYWERRRPLYNLALVPPTVLGYVLWSRWEVGVARYLSDPVYVLLLLVGSVLLANVCYTAAYAVEFLLGTDEPSSPWLRFGRFCTFLSGVSLGMFLALGGGQQIAYLEFAGH
jgi:hypothetical protein